MKYLYSALVFTLGLLSACGTASNESTKTTVSHVAPVASKVQVAPTPTEPSPKIDTLHKAVDKPKKVVKPKDAVKPVNTKAKNTKDKSAKEKKDKPAKEKNAKKKMPKKPNDKFVNLRFDKNAIPKSIKFLGKATGGAHWKDKGGENWVILAEIEAYDSDTEGKDAEIYAYKFNKADENDTTFKLQWKEHDFVTRCDFSVVCGFLKGTNITDLDADGIGEITFLYKTGCRKEKIPMKMRLVMYEGSRKYTMQGKTVLDASEIDEEKLEETRTKEGAWASLPEEMTEFADKKWKNNLLE